MTSKKGGLHVWSGNGDNETPTEEGEKTLVHLVQFHHSDLQATNPAVKATPDGLQVQHPCGDMQYL
ncbi:hypothetical protein SOASR030_03590 [Leminorella grimontii]|uniref:Uncharacterized protein n=1 Tax=Leminorella grimontii TaxID=82981 RepID=A0AAV5MXQ9_9GAMM|nr:hypothetical protein SOASR030_03590 [Leminorella grimontii]GKX57688.1 hypothetical protein SOASR031_00030 [Leminorella grimontii]